MASMSRTAWRMALGACIALGACGRTSLSEEDGAFYRWDDRSVHCAAEIDDSDQISMESITAGLDRAQREHSVLELLVHRPGESMSRPNFERLLDEVTARGLPFLTVKDMLAAPAGAGVALMFDDAYPDVWLGVEDLLQTHDAHVTLYITWYTRLQQTQRDQIRQLADAGHDIEAHSVNHVRGSDYVEGHGLDAYLHDEVIPSFEVLRADGYDPVSYAYPFGMRTDEIDRAILDSGYARTVRALVQPNPVREATCPF